MRRSFPILAAVAAAVPFAPVRAEFPLDRPAPPFTRKTLAGRPLSLASLRGKVVLLDFWGPS
jgi:hypothetical protein